MFATNRKRHIPPQRGGCAVPVLRNDWTVSRVLYQTTIYLGPASPQGSCHHRDARGSAYVPYGCCFRQGLHSRKVASALVSSYLAFPSLPLSRRFLSVALSLGSPPAAVSSYSVSVKPGLSSGSPCRLSRRRMFHSFSQEVYHIPGALARKIISTVSAPTAAAAKSAVPSRRAGPIPRHRRP